MIRDEIETNWISDIRSVLNINGASATALHSLIKNLICHDVFEQLVDENKLDEFSVNISGILEGTLKRDEDGWTLTNVTFGKAFVATLNETLRCRESNLYREAYENALLRLRNGLDTFSDGNKLR